MKEIYENAVDSLKVGMEFFLTDDSYSSRKHAILTLFHAIELFLKEYLFRVNPILIYKNIDKKITEDSFTAGISEILIRLDNIDSGIPPDQVKIIKNIQSIRNRIEHHRYDHKDEDKDIISESLKFILLFVEHQLHEKLENDIDADLLRKIQQLVFEYNEKRGLAEYRIDNWLAEKWPNWDPYKEDSPEEFEGTLDCPECRMSYLVIDGMDEPFCFWCNTKIEAAICEDCGVVFLSGEKHECF